MPDPKYIPVPDNIFDPMVVSRTRLENHLREVAHMLGHAIGHCRPSEVAQARDQIKMTLQTMNQQAAAWGLGPVSADGE